MCNDLVLDREWQEWIDFASARSAKGRVAWEKNKGNIAPLIKYWTVGKGGRLKIIWGAPCDFCRCVSHLSEYVPPGQLKGFCAKLHKKALGVWPGQESGSHGKKGKKCGC